MAQLAKCLHRSGVKKGRKTKHGIFGELVCSLAPTIPVTKTGANNSQLKKSGQTAKGFKAPLKKNNKSSEAIQVKETADVMSDDGQAASHQGLPVQGRRCKLSITINIIHI